MFVAGSTAVTNGIFGNDLVEEIYGILGLIRLRISEEMASESTHNGRLVIVLIIDLNRGPICPPGGRGTSRVQGLLPRTGQQTTKKMERKRMNRYSP
jgi:hypothetical protein